MVFTMTALPTTVSKAGRSRVANQSQFLGLFCAEAVGTLGVVEFGLRDQIADRLRGLLELLRQNFGPLPRTN